MNIRTGLILCTVLALAACGTPPQSGGDRRSPGAAGSGGYLPGDGPGAEDAARLNATTDAVPRDEPLHRFANRPYDALGVHYVPLATAGNYKERGTASWYGKKFHGQRTSSGEVYNMYAMSAAHKTLPIPSYARVTSLRTGKSVIVRVNDRGPFVHGRIIDLSYAAATKLDLVASGSGEVEVESLVPGRDAPAPQPVVADPVRVEPLQPELTAAAPAPRAPAAITAPVPAQPGRAASAGAVFLQLGSFRSRYSAAEYLERMRAKLQDGREELSLLASGGLTRVRLGPYRSDEDARASAEALAPRLGFKPFVIRP